MENQKVKILGWHKTKREEYSGDINIEYNGLKYRIGMTEFYGGAGAYGIAKEGEDCFICFNQKGPNARHIKKMYVEIKPELNNWLNTNQLPGK